MNEFPQRRIEDDAGISHVQRHQNIEARVATLERRDMYIMLLLAINTMLTAGDVVTKLGPIIHTFGIAIGFKW